MFRQLVIPHLDPNSLTVEVSGAPERRRPCVEVKQGRSREGKQGDDHRSRERREEQLEKEIHDPKPAGKQQSETSFTLK